MPLHRPKQPVCVAIGCSGVALLFQLVAVAGTGWLMFKDWAKACQAFSILALGTTFCSCVLGILHILREETQALTLLAAGVNAIAAVYIAVEVGVFAGETMDLVTNTTFTVSYGYGFYLSIVAGVLSVAAALFYIVGRAPVRHFSLLYDDCLEITLILSIPTKSDYWRVCQVLSLLGEGTIFASFVIGLLHLFREDTTRFTVPVTALSAISVAILVVEVGVFAGKTSAVYPITFTYGYGFYLSIAAAVLSLVSTILHAGVGFAPQ